MKRRRKRKERRKWKRHMMILMALIPQILVPSADPSSCLGVQGCKSPQRRKRIFMKSYQVRNFIF
jgi:hypothetical protein